MIPNQQQKWLVVRKLARAARRRPHCQPPDAEDGFQWYCEQCGNLLHEDRLKVTDIVNDLPRVMNQFYESLEQRTCKKCGHVMEPPKKVA
jgi:3-hydroxyanthranilate 3,4-dioxygenase